MHPLARAALARTDHRPWPMPQRPWAFRQAWCDLLFAHWPVPAAALRPLVPAALRIDETGGTSWVGLVPFRMEGVSFRGVPDLPGVSAFVEMNLRLYVTDGAKPGIWFLSMDANHRPAVRVARTFFHLPYFHARMSVCADGDGIVYGSQRTSGTPPIGFEASWRPVSPSAQHPPGSIEHWLTERYCLYAQSRRGALIRQEVQHAAWPLQRAEARITRNDLGRPFGLDLGGPPALLHCSRRLDAVLWTQERIEG